MGIFLKQIKVQIYVKKIKLMKIHEQKKNNKKYVNSELGREKSTDFVDQGPKRHF